ncbi:OmpA family protein [Riemerella columbina]|uniref:OmpA family protein n=1 Tax=Riemerella columbina TaxID=103810 RepID=UPI00037EC78B|nr:OmpA family protein [Riemerella columbina]
MKIFNKTNIAALFLSGSLMLTSCEAVQNSNNQQRGTAIGTAAGAVIGGILGNNVGKGGNTAAGAVLGGIIGGVAGNVIGRKMDKQAKDIKEALPGAEVERVNEGIKLVLGENTVNFGFDSANLTPTAKNNLDRLVKVFKENPDTNISIYGYTDSKGSDSYNLALSERRANAVVAYLSANGIKRSRLTAKGMGEAEPIASNDTDAGRAQNRRVEFAITANEKMVEDAKKGQ